MCKVDVSRLIMLDVRQAKIGDGGTVRSMSRVRSNNVRVCIPCRMQSAGVQSAGMQSAGMQSAGMQSAGMQSK